MPLKSCSTRARYFGSRARFSIHDPLMLFVEEGILERASAFEYDMKRASIFTGDTSRLLGFSSFLELRDIGGRGLGWLLCRFLEVAQDKSTVGRFPMFSLNVFLHTAYKTWRGKWVTTRVSAEAATILGFLGFPFFLSFGKSLAAVLAGPCVDSLIGLWTEHRESIPNVFPQCLRCTRLLRPGQGSV